MPNQSAESDFSLTRATAYLDFIALPNLLQVYFDEKVAPDNVENREAYVLFTPHNGRYVVKAGQMFLPYGLRLQDDDAFVRQTSGVNFRTPDDGIELGLELPKWSAQMAVTKGAADNGSDDRVSLSAVYVRPRWRVGASYNKNPDPLGDREMEAMFAGWKTGPIAWLAELDFITDEITDEPEQPDLRELDRGQLAHSQRPQPQGHLRVSEPAESPGRGRAGTLQRGLGILADPVRPIARRDSPLQRHPEPPGEQPERVVRRAARIFLEAGFRYWVTAR